MRTPPPPARLRALGGMLVAAAFCSTGIAPAQGVSGQDIEGIPVPPIQVGPGYRPDVPNPPRGLAGRLPSHDTPPVPIGPYRPGPTTPPSVDVDPSGPQPITGQFRYFLNQPVDPSPGNTSVVGEPSVAMKQDTILQSGNWYVARSIDNGETWTYVSPYSFFTPVDGGFCCDQRMYYVRSHDITVWLLQYGYSSTTRDGRYRLAVANGRADLRSTDPNDWRLYDYRPSQMGFGTGNWFDFPDVAVSAGKFHVSCNVFSGTGGGYQGSVRWRVDLQNMKDNVNAAWGYSTNSTLLGSTYRFAEGGASDRVYFAAMKSTSEIYVYYVTDSGSWNRVTRGVGSFSNATASCPGPDSRDWCGRVTGRFRGSFGTSSQVGWMLTSAAHGSRPLPYTRIMRFTADNNRTLIAEQDIWSSALTWAYAAARQNSLGHVGMVFAVGGPSSYVHSSATIFDSYQPFGTPVTTYSMGAGTHGPFQNRWGDYFDVHAHPNDRRTFIGTGMRQNGGANNSDNEPRWAWFGRDDYQPTWVTLNVQSTPVTGVPITTNVTDRLGRGGGNTNYTRSYAPSQGYAVTAPLLHTSGSVYVFERWSTASVSGGTLVNRPVGERTYEASTIGSVDDDVIARYVLRRTLTVQSKNPSSGVAITVSVDDVNGNQNGNTTFTRYYRDGDVVGLTAPGSVGFNPFRRWVVNGVVQPGNPINVAMTTTRTAVAEYWLNIAGSVRTIGAGCPGSSGVVPVQSITWPAGQQGPQQGTPTTYRLSRARANTAGVLHFGIDNKIWNGFPLPFDLSVFGMTKCFLYHDLVVSPSVSIDSLGRASLAATWPVDPATIGAPIFSTFGVVDIGANPLHVVHSNSMETKPGGNR